MKQTLSTLAVAAALSVLVLAACGKKEPVSGPSADTAASVPDAAMMPSSAASDSSMASSAAAPMDSISSAGATSGAASDAKP